MEKVLGTQHDGMPVHREMNSDAQEITVDCLESCTASVGRGRSKMLMPLEQGKRYSLELEGNAFAAISANVKIVVAEPVVAETEDIVKEPVVAPVINDDQDIAPVVKENKQGNPVAPIVDTKGAQQTKKSAKKK